MVLPAHILLPPPRDVAQGGQPSSPQLPPGAIIIGRVLSASGAPLEHVADGAPGVRVQFPLGVVVVPPSAPFEQATQLYAQVRELQGQTVLALLEGVQSGTVFRAAAESSAPAAGETTVLVAGESSPVLTAEPVQAGQPLLVQVQPRGARAVLQQVPATVAAPEPARGVVVAADGPIAIVRVEQTPVLARAAAPLSVGQEVHVTVPPSADVPVVVTQPAGGTAAPAPLPGATVSVAAGVSPQAALQTLGLPITPENTAAVAALQTAEVPVATARTVDAAAVLLRLDAPVDRVNVTAAQALVSADVPVAERTLALGRVLVAATVPVSAEAVAAADALVRIDVPVTAESVPAAQVLVRLGIEVTPRTVAAAQALQQAGIPVTPPAVRAVQPFLDGGAPVSPPAVAAAVALAEIVAAPRPESVNALARFLSAPSALSRDIGAVRDALLQIVPRVPAAVQPHPRGFPPPSPQTVPQVPAAVQPVLQEIVSGLTAVLLDLDAPLPEEQIAHSARFGGVQTERFLARLAQAPGGSAAGERPAVPQAATDAARDVRVLLGRLQTVLREVGPDAQIPADVRATLDDGAARIVDRLQGLQLQNLRAPLLEHLTLELPVAGDTGLEHVQVRVYYRPEEGGRRREIDARNTTVALLLDTTRLGRVTTTLTIADGRINTDFRVDSEHVAQHLLRGAEELRAGLEEAGYESGRISAVARRPAAAVATDATARLGPDGIDVRV